MPQIYNAYRGANIPVSRPALAPPPPPPSRNHKPREAQIGLKLYLWLFDVAKAGEPAPTNKAICERFGFKSFASAAREVATLESTGLIEVERKRASRRIFVRESQRWTA